MSYEYTDGDGDILKIRRASSTDGVLFTLYGTSALGVAIKSEDAPAVALALLEAAGLGVAGVDNLTSVMNDLRLYIKEVEEERAEAQAREAEDAKVQEFRDALIAAKYTQGHVTPWDSLTEFERSDIRAHYRAAREFFTRDEKPAKCCGMPGQCAAACQDEKPAPRVLNYGDGEPPRNTEWRAANDSQWSWQKAADTPISQGWYAGAGFYEWDEIKSHHFPMTEVTG